MLKLGAINKSTSVYTRPCDAKKDQKYICPDCHKDLILVKGEKRTVDFRHFSEKDPCYYYDIPNESQIHRDAKLRLQSFLLDASMQINIVRRCLKCQTPAKWKIHRTNFCDVVCEYRFTHNNSQKIADIACTNNAGICAIFEVMHSHKTSEDARPEPWYEIRALEIINAEVISRSIELECCREVDDICTHCSTNELCLGLEKQNIVVKQSDVIRKFVYDLGAEAEKQIKFLINSILARYIRGRLEQVRHALSLPIGESLLETREAMDAKTAKIEQEMDECLRADYRKARDEDIEYYFDHLKYCNVCGQRYHNTKFSKCQHSINIETSAKDQPAEILKNKELVDSLSEFWNYFGFKLVLHTWKGATYFWFVDPANFVNFDYWFDQNMIRSWHSEPAFPTLNRRWRLSTEQQAEEIKVDYDLSYDELASELFTKLISHILRVAKLEDEPEDNLPKKVHTTTTHIAPCVRSCKAVELRVAFENKEKIKKYKAKWSCEKKVWILAGNIFEKHKNEILKFASWVKSE